jgi:hypothetical protein
VLIPSVNFENRTYIIQTEVISQSREPNSPYFSSESRAILIGSPNFRYKMRKTEVSHWFTVYSFLTGTLKKKVDIKILHFNILCIND